ncbi:hypothetical protein M422DRAFT_76330 [Sphaerobolus stellatus SS14]|uniref:NAD-dependent epimerase/dehydratase domain-containing protein n=1 Tax=Sphaerobolus stellatus (strain SS14) TaxID=990650 RepID=A0A0C9V1D7_SPHS4|nr:hypothetical protein M422DRAFT_76330 [Sphaerobolus stellatus SS14]
MPSISTNSLVVVTGITGYIASHVALTLLREGHRVRGTTRPTSIERANSDLKKAFTENGITSEILQERLEIVGLDGDDFYSEEAWTRVFDGADGVEHIAFPIQEIDASAVDKAVQNATNMLRAAKQTSTIKRFVYTSSAMATIIAPDYVDRTITVKDWNESAVNVIVNGASIDDYPALKKAGMLVTYAAAKVMAEKVCFEFMEKEKPSFELVTILPSTTLGPVLHGKPSMTPGLIYSTMQNDISWKDNILPQWTVDVRDVAKLHYLGLTREDMVGKRWFAASGPWGPNDIFAIIRKAFPGHTIPDNFEGGERDKQQYDNSGSTSLLGGKWIGLEQSVLDTIESLRARDLVKVEGRV